MANIDNTEFFRSLTKEEEMKDNGRLLELAISLLDDEHGISEKSYDILSSMLTDVPHNASTKDPADTGKLFRMVKATDGRYYIPHLD